jgi:hypothetical protein
MHRLHRSNKGVGATTPREHAMWAWVMGKEGGNVRPHRLSPQRYPCRGAPLASPRLSLPLHAGAPERCRFPALPPQLTAIAAIPPSPLLLAPPSWPHPAPSPCPPASKHQRLFQQPNVPATSVLVVDCCVLCVLSYAFLSPLDCLRKGTAVVVLPCCCHPLPPSSSPSPLPYVACRS